MLLAFLRRYATHPCCVYDAQFLTHAVFMLFGIVSPLRTVRTESAPTMHASDRRVSNASTITCSSRIDKSSASASNQQNSSTTTECWAHTLVRLLVMLTQWCGCLAALWIALERDENFISFFFESDVSKVTSLIELVLSMVAVTVIYGMSFTRREHVQRLFVLVHFIDGRLDGLLTDSPQQPDGSDVTTAVLRRLYRRTVIFSMGCTVVNLAVLTLYIGYSYAMQWTTDRSARMYAWVAYFWPQIVLAMVVDQAMCWLWQLARRFDQLNQVNISLHTRAPLMNHLCTCLMRSFAFEECRQWMRVEGNRW